MKAYALQKINKLLVLVILDLISLSKVSYYSSLIDRKNYG